MLEAEGSDDFPWHVGVFDAHCHPTDTMASIKDISRMHATALTIMATRAQDQDLVSDVCFAQPISLDAVRQGPTKFCRGLVPSFGWHPWFSHQLFDDQEPSELAGVTSLSRPQKIAHYKRSLSPTIEDESFIEQLPDPMPLSAFIDQTRQRLERHPFALVGEVGLDKGFRLPEAWLPGEDASRDEGLTPGGREGRRLSPYRVNMDHQKAVLLAQLRLAGELQRAVSCHGVQAHGVLYETIRETWRGHERAVLSKREHKQLQKHPEQFHTEDQVSGEEGGVTAGPKPKPYPPRLCLHSYSGPVGPVSQYTHPSVPIDIFFSFSLAVNFSTPAAQKTEQVIQAVPADRILIESDLHTAGADMDEHLKGIARKVSALKGWTLDQGLQRLAQNWRRFVFGIANDEHGEQDA